ncbi:2-amino-4-hydroxy-6-hydroxymethyldihydropteridinediphosphokinase [Amphibacillus marinus]|uniref:2-amino-4-hydroxy-6-hydroxymethyldihydropteridine diphosphokinase n=1 Tax=Amphibacillus marinus TaxID=872970 RepID=A0A1H8TKU1_9BACI|nr:2-amino-4-hydroxy-6-hydroxymethyldihydropteridine diphosphokinase [Amphibacillus marinus]SEO91184.1 2-amino-4-hydroxy-6-hydroxymethyldihydropteridinediphosphokinase [Amphibacillus marinus]
MNRVYIALGSNISPREGYLNQAVLLLDKSEHVQVVRNSSIYETKPMGYQNQEDFLNKVIEVRTSLSAEQLLYFCQEIEEDLGRERLVRWGPRTIDLDILIYNEEKMVTNHLTIPHPHMHLRAFVLIPLAELNNTLVIPGINQTVGKCLTQMSIDEKRGVIKWISQDGEKE